MKLHTPLTHEERSSKFFRALDAWEKMKTENTVDGPREHFLRGFLTGFDSVTDSQENIQASLEAIFTASQAAEKARPQSGEAVLNSPSSQGTRAVPAFEQSTAGMPLQPSSVQDAPHEVLGQRLVGLPPEARQIQSGPLWADRVLYSLKRAFR